MSGVAGKHSWQQAVKNFKPQRKIYFAGCGEVRSASVAKKKWPVLCGVHKSVVVDLYQCCTGRVSLSSEGAVLIEGVLKTLNFFLKGQHVLLKTLFLWR
jgi:hypothetical protein